MEKAKEKEPLLTINAQDVFDITEDRAAESGESFQTLKPLFYLNFNKKAGPLHDYVILSSDIHGDCALFDQIQKVIAEKEFAGKLRFSTAIIYLDFSQTFNKIGFNAASELVKKIDDPNLGKDELLLTKLLNPETGLHIRYNGGEEHTYVPFDKSASMARSCRITYIEKSIRDALEKRLLLDLDFSRISLQLSKFYAYRGLYLTTARRISKENLILNKETVIVIPDIKQKACADFDDDMPRLYTADTTASQESCHSFKEVTKEEEINVFDGEGLISPDYAQMLKDQMPNGSAGTFQIRMPFTKGMLHAVNLTRFFEDVLPSGFHYYIQDYFDKERDLSKVKIILTESMFKCASWLKNAMKDTNTDPMEYYFDEFKKYDHALYVSGSDSSFLEDDTDRLNYQFLDTLNISPVDFKKLVDKHYEIGYEEIKEKFNPADRTKEPAETLLAAAYKNDGFYAEPLLESWATSAVKRLHLDCGMGRLRAPGIHRYLSGDLLYFLICIAKKICGPDGNKNLNDLEGKILKGRFFIPETPEQFQDTDRFYALFRNPHLSRNEELLLKSYYSEDPRDPYIKYFQDLRGLLMLPSDSLAPMILGGADYDGDEVKVYSSELIVNAVKSGGYTDDGKRRLPIVKIPTESSAEQYPGDPVEFVKLIINTFSSITGAISNLSSLFANKEYLYKETPGTKTGNCATATAIAGLEIDSAKYGYHPIPDYKELQNKLENSDRYFLRIKNTIKKAKAIECHVDLIKNNGSSDTYRFFPYSSSSVSALIKPQTAEKPNLFSLPLLFAEKEHQFEQESDFLRTEGILRCPPEEKKRVLFNFESEKNDWREELNKDKLEEVKKLWKDYDTIRSDLRRFRNVRDRALANKYSDDAKALLELKYDDINAELPETGRSPEQLLEDFLDLAGQQLETPDKVTKALAAIETKQWIFTPETKRKTLLLDILDLPDDDSLSGPMADLICDFSCQGFLLLIDAVCAVSDSIYKKMTLEKFICSRHKEDEAERLRKLLPESIIGHKEVTETDEEETEEDSAEEPDEIRSDDLDTTVRAQLFRIVTGKPEPDEDNIDVLKYAYAAKESKNGRFFWDILPGRIILDNIAVESGDKDA